GEVSPGNGPVLDPASPPTSRSSRGEDAPRPECKQNLRPKPGQRHTRLPPLPLWRRDVRRVPCSWPPSARSPGLSPAVSLFPHHVPTPPKGSTRGQDKARFGKEREGGCCVPGISRRV